MSVNRWQPWGAATLVGSLPHRDRSRAIELIFREMRQIPGWPQLSAFPMEQMMLQFTEGLAGLARREQGACFLTKSSRFEEELLEFYEDYLAVTEGRMPLDKSRFRLGEQSGRSFFAFLKRLPGLQPPPLTLKGQIVGPFTLLAGLKREDGRLALYDHRLRDMVVKCLALKAQWQAEQLGRFATPPIVFIDEPALAGFGTSAFISISAKEVCAMLEEVANHIHKASGLAGVHVCANTDWSLFFGGSLDIINFDSYSYFERFALYRRQLLDFISRGGLVAWGIVPTMDEEAITRESPHSLAERWQCQIQELADHRLSLRSLFARSLITPSCGCATLGESAAERVVALTRQASELLQREFNAGQPGLPR